jgi:hypothetical protein
MRIAVLILLALTACVPQDSDCLGDSPARVRDPRTASCIEVGDADACRYCSTTRSCLVSDAAALDFASCGSVAQVAESACLDLSGHLAAYAGGDFLACWTTAPSGPIHGGGCVGLDAYQCSRHDNCTARYDRTNDGALDFARCADEPAR